MTFDEAKVLLNGMGHFSDAQVRTFAEMMAEMTFMRSQGRALEFISRIEQHFLRKHVLAARQNVDEELIRTALLAVEVTPIEVGFDAGADPPITVYNVVLWMPLGTWNETYGDKEQLFAFLRGIKAVTFSAGLKVKWPVRYQP